jgi:hypothetical protein
MAWEQVWPNDIRAYQGRSTDGTKPIAPEGSKCYHLDDGTRWTYHKGEGWVPSIDDIALVWDTDLLAPVLMQQPMLKVDAMTVELSGINTMVRELKKMNVQLAVMTGEEIRNAEVR